MQNLKEMLLKLIKENQKLLNSKVKEAIPQNETICQDLITRSRVCNSLLFFLYNFCNKKLKKISMEKKKGKKMYFLRNWTNH